MAIAAAEAMPAAPRRRGNGRVLSFMGLTFEVLSVVGVGVTSYDTPRGWCRAVDHLGVSCDRRSRAGPGVDSWCRIGAVTVSYLVAVQRIS